MTSCSTESFGLEPWSKYATAGRVLDFPGFNGCIEKTSADPQAGRQQLGKELGIHGAPPLIVRFCNVGRPPTFDELEAVGKVVLAGKSPIPGRT
jgi:protein-disulfide isomerase